MKQIAEKTFPSTLEALAWRNKKYSDEGIYSLSLQAVIGVGVKITIFVRDIEVEPEPAPVVKKVKTKKK